MKSWTVEDGGGLLSPRECGPSSGADSDCAGRTDAGTGGPAGRWVARARISSTEVMREPPGEPGADPRVGCDCTSVRYRHDPDGANTARTRSSAAPSGCCAPGNFQSMGKKSRGRVLVVERGVDWLRSVAQVLVSCGLRRCRGRQSERCAAVLSTGRPRRCRAAGFPAARFERPAVAAVRSCPGPW